MWTQIQGSSTAGGSFRYCVSSGKKEAGRCALSEPSHSAVSVGRSVLNRSSRLNVGVLMSLFGGGGHKGAGGCVVPLERAEATLKAILDAIRRDDR